MSNLGDVLKIILIVRTARMFELNSAVPYMTVADIILSQVMIKPDYAV